MERFFSFVKPNLNLVIISLFAILLTACGGGGSSDTSADPDPTLPTISISNTQALHTETSVEIVVALSEISDKIVTVNYATLDGSALDSTDYIAQSGTIEFAVGEINKTIVIELVASRDTSTSKNFLVDISNPVNATLETSQSNITLLDSDETVLPSILIADTQTIDSAQSVEVGLTLSAASTEVISVNYATADGTALAATDYITATGTVEFAVGETSKTITIELVYGRDTSSTKTFVINLSDPINATIADTEASITLLDAEHSAMFNNPTYSANWGTKSVFTEANTCASCHTGTTTVMNYSGKDISPVTGWRHSTMAHALNDPYFNAVVEEETHVFPDKKVFIEDSCMRCHAPMAYTHAHQNPELLVEDPTGLSEDGGYPFATAMGDHHAREGIACTACHQIQPDNLGNLESMSGHYKIKSETENNGVDPSIFGPFNDPVGQAMQNNTQYTPEYAAHIGSSAMCASCHNLYTPSLDLEGNPVMIGDKIAQFPEQTPYWEWLNSRYPDDGKNCQTCHMATPDPDYKTAITTRPDNSALRPSDGDLAAEPDSVFSAHEFVGSNTYLLSLLKTYMQELGIADSTNEAGFDTKIEETRTLLQSAAVLTIGATSIADNTLTVPVTITNNTGHKLPTSYPSRRMWVHMTVTDNNGATIFESGAVDEKGRLAKDEDFTAYKCLDIYKADGFDSIADGCYEPHRNTITSPEQVAIYEGVLGDVNQNITHVILHARQYLKDNRIPPQGWTLANQHTNPVDPDIKDDGIVGLANSDSDFATGKDAAGSDGKDTLTYQVDITGGTAPYNITVDLFYQTIKPSFVYAMHADDPEHGIEGDSFVRRFKYMYEETPPIVESLAPQATATTP
ncbi:MAG: Calx-beta domain-containing protein [Pseudomonadota bacterium]|nr:Calx-beta domain-containing protein [Pseudomonadota bacterium]